LESTKSEFILVGDLDSKSKLLGCKSQDSSGTALDDVLTDTSFLIFNEKSQTYFQHRGDVRMQSNKEQYTEILDLALGQPNMADKVRKFKVLNEFQMESDHCSISFIINLTGGTRFLNNNNKTRYIFEWVLFRNLL